MGVLKAIFVTLGKLLNFSGLRFAPLSNVVLTLGGFSDPSQL